MKITKAIKKILVIDLAFIGDVVLATPVIRALKAEYPAAEITMLTMPLTAPIAEMNPYVDNVMVYDKRGKHRGLGGMFAISRELRRQKFTMAVCMNFAVRGAAVAWLAGIPYRIGYDAQHAGWFLTHVTSSERGGIFHETQNHLQVLKSLDILPVNTELEMQVPELARESLMSKISFSNNGKQLLIVCPFGSYPRKNFSIEKYGKLLTRLKNEMTVVLIGGKKEQDSLQQIAALADLPQENILAGTLNLQELASLIQQADIMLTVDTGPMHIAQAVNTKVVALFGPTDPIVWGPRGKNDIIFYKKLECSPCWGKGECQLNNCMEQHSLTEIAECLRSAVLKENEA